MKICGTCRQSKPLDDFNRKSSRLDGRQEVCRDCNRQSSRAYYARNRDRHVQAIVQRTAQRRVESKAFLVAYLREHPCIDCGNSDLRVLDFDHRPGAGKRKDVMSMVKEGFSRKKLEDEIAKCDVRCRNCHAIVTLERAGRNWRSDAMRQEASNASTRQRTADTPASAALPQLPRERGTVTVPAASGPSR
ncbi:hypothetical protein JNB62_17650 [Microbacterium jejuense]|uniref:HNH endonuclease n=1 Tax=Microbacterium jejuense TaxID=1263637 RepID=A0ABS7HRK9_9MICO|nr:hypothetical protein [Microbacterium jejuense]MBW9095508.1 hypothetical protein [Microbacterium jejuense]